MFSENQSLLLFCLFGQFDIYFFKHFLFFSIIFVCVCFKEWMTAHKILTMLKKGVAEGNLWEEKMPRVDGVEV